MKYQGNCPRCHAHFEVNMTSLDSPDEEAYTREHADSSSFGMVSVSGESKIIKETIQFWCPVCSDAVTARAK